HLQHTVDQQHRVAMRQAFHNLLDVEFYFWRILHEIGVTNIKMESGPALRVRLPSRVQGHAGVGAARSVEAERPHCVASRCDRNTETRQCSAPASGCWR